MLLDEPVAIRRCGLEGWFSTSMKPITEVTPKELFPALNRYSSAVRGRCVVINAANIEHASPLCESSSCQSVHSARTTDPSTEVLMEPATVSGALPQ
ncbi:MAG: hypothetical protein HRU82_18830 [Nitrospira sp.]|nr:MAG: hypothetical protein HRU82_18830 [Nitrospira sp.]